MRTSDDSASPWEHSQVSPPSLWPSDSLKLPKSTLKPHDEGPHYIPKLFTICSPPSGPRMYRKHVCRSTVNVFRSNKSKKRKKKIPENTGARLERVIYHENFVNHATSLIPKHDEFWIKSSDEESCTFLTKILPDFTSADLTRRAHSEKDIEDWVFTVIMLPILRAWLAVEHKQICAIYDDPSWIFCSSPSGGSAIPDGIILDNRIPESRKRNPLIVIEVKTPNSLQKESIEDRGTLEPLIPGPLDRMQGHIMKFCWPQRFDRGAPMSSQTKILTQVWQQMIVQKVDFNILSSYESTYFFFRKNNTMYISRPYHPGNTLLLAVFAVVGLALKQVSRARWEETLPPDDLRPRWWPTEVDNPPSTMSGVHKMTLPIERQHRRNLHAMDIDHNSDVNDRTDSNDDTQDHEEAEASDRNAEVSGEDDLGEDTEDTDEDAEDTDEEVEDPDEDAGDTDEEVEDPDEDADEEVEDSDEDADEDEDEDAEDSDEDEDAEDSDEDEDAEDSDEDEDAEDSDEDADADEDEDAEYSDEDAEASDEDVEASDEEVQDSEMMDLVSGM